MAEFVTLADLHDAVRSAGLEVTDSKLKRLRQAGLIPKPDPAHPIGKPGSQSRYPPWAVEQLVGVLRLRSEGVRTFAALRFLAWESGLWVDFNQLRGDIVDQTREQIRGWVPHPKSDQADDRLDQKLRTAKSSGPHPFRSLPVHKSTSVDLAFAAGQRVFGTPDSDFADEGIDGYLPSSHLFERLTGEAVQDDEIEALSQLIAALAMPPPGKWPRIISRASRPHFELARRLLFLLIQMPTEPVLMEGNTERAIANRAMQAAGAVVLAKAQPNHPIVKALTPSEMT